MLQDHSLTAMLNEKIEVPLVEFNRALNAGKKDNSYDFKKLGKLGVKLFNNFKDLAKHLRESASSKADVKQRETILIATSRIEIHIGKLMDKLRTKNMVGSIDDVAQIQASIEFLMDELQ